MFCCEDLESPRKIAFQKHRQRWHPMGFTPPSLLMMELAAVRRNKKNVSPVDGPLVAVGFPRCVTRSVLMKPLVVGNFYNIKD